MKNINNLLQARRMKTLAEEMNRKKNTGPLSRTEGI